MSIQHSEKVRLTRKHYPTLKELKLAVLKGEYHQGIAFFSRSFLWKTVCLNSYKVEFLEDELKPVPSVSSVEVSSANDTDNNSDTSPSSVGRTKTPSTLEPTTSDPLSQPTPDTTHHTSDEQDILHVIRMDVDRLLIAPIFTQSEVKADITQILYNYNNFTPYKQGYHEICGLVYLQLYNDDPTNDKIRIETFNIFTSLMLSVVPNFYNEDSLIGWCISVFNKYLRLIDPPLYDLLVRQYRIESQIWLIRWVRLVFLRELGMDNTLKLLDFLVCYDHDLCKLFPFLIVLFLIKIKLELAHCEDNGEVLYLLLHYPHKEMTMEEIKEIGDYAIQLYGLTEDKLGKAGLALNNKWYPGIKWEKMKDLGRLRMELKLQRRVRGALNGKK